jgi:hypothetical protein
LDSHFKQGRKNIMVENDKFTKSQMDPYHAEGSDFHVKPVVAGTGQSGPKGTASGKDELAHASCSPRALESDSLDGPSVWGKGGKAFTVGTCDEGGQSVTQVDELDLKTGAIGCKGFSATAAGEVPDPHVKIK